MFYSENNVILGQSTSKRLPAACPFDTRYLQNHVTLVEFYILMRPCVTSNVNA